METLNNTKSMENITICEMMLSKLPIGLVMIDEDTNVIEANNYMLDYFNLHNHSLIGQQFGNLFKCEYAETHHLKCGTGEKCKSCIIRNSITKVLLNNETLNETDINHRFTIDNRSYQKWFSVFASPVYKDNRKYVLASFVDITNRKKYEDDLIRLSVTDELTGVYNRLYILNHFEHNLKDFNANKSSYCIAIIDIDKFKNVNDKFGHVTGDYVLKSLTSIADKNIRKSDYIGRYGGEEFLILFPETNLLEANKVLNRINRVFAKKMTDYLGTPITFSGGLIEISDMVQQNCKAMDIIQKADKILYKAKENGRNRVETK